MLDSHDETITTGDHVVFDDGDTTTPWLKHGTVIAIDETTVTIASAEHDERTYNQAALVTGPDGFPMSVPPAIRAMGEGELSEHVFAVASTSEATADRWSGEQAARHHRDQDRHRHHAGLVGLGR